MVEVKGCVCTSLKALPSSDSSRGRFEGDLSTYGNVDLGNDVCEAGCFDRSVAEKGTHYPLLWQHRDDSPIGSFDVTSTQGTLRIKGEFNLDTQLGREAFSLLRHGDACGLSIGYRCKDYRYDDQGVRHLLDLDLVEGSFVTFPMNEQAHAWLPAKSRRLRMSRYAGCAFIKAMSEDERNAALAELDELDKEATEQEAPKDPAKEPDPAPAQDVPSEEPKEPEKAPDTPPTQDPPAAQTENTDDTEQSESEVAKVFREVGQALIELRNLMEA